MKLVGIFSVLLYFLTSCNTKDVKIYPFKADQISEVEDLVKNCKLPDSYKQGFFETFNNPNKNYSKLVKKNYEKIGANITINGKH